jgi:hypothetical protein
MMAAVLLMLFVQKCDEEAGGEKEKWKVTYLNAEEIRRCFNSNERLND